VSPSCADIETWSTIVDLLSARSNKAVSGTDTECLGRVRCVPRSAPGPARRLREAHAACRNSAWSWPTSRSPPARFSLIQLAAHAAVAQVPFPSHRGALLWYPDVSAIFGNDGYSHPNAQAEVTLLRHKLAHMGVEELAFAVHNEYSWLLLARTANVRKMNELVWKCCGIAEDDPRYEIERNEAFSRLYSYLTTPHKPGPGE